MAGWGRFKLSSWEFWPRSGPGVFAAAISATRGCRGRKLESLDACLGSHMSWLKVCVCLLSRAIEVDAASTV